VAAIRILVADDHEVVRKGLVDILKQKPQWQVCGEARDGREAIELAQQFMPDVIVMDISMPGLNGLEATRHIVKVNPATKVLVLTLLDSDDIIRDVLNAGARGCLLVAAVDALLRDKTYFTTKVADMVLEGYLRGGSPIATNPLTPREREVVQLLAEGSSTKEVAVALGLSFKTAETHRSNIMRKLHIHCVGDLVIYAVRNNIVQVAQARVG
jgi:DNA-binding NarL/FixJ family response regulator